MSTARRASNLGVDDGGGVNVDRPLRRQTLPADVSTNAERLSTMPTSVDATFRARTRATTRRWIRRRRRKRSRQNGGQSF